MYSINIQGTMYVVQEDSEATINHQRIERIVSDKNVRMYARPGNNIERIVSDKNVRMYPRPGNNMCPVASFQEYLRKCSPKCPAFFQRPRVTFNDTDNISFENKPLGKINLET